MKTKKNRGFSLIETMIALSLLLVSGTILLQKKQDDLKVLEGEIQGKAVLNIAEAVTKYVIMTDSELRSGNNTDCVWLNNKCELSEMALKKVDPRATVSGVGGVVYRVFLIKMEPPEPEKANLICGNQSVVDIAGCKSSGDVESWNKKIKSLIIMSEGYKNGIEIKNKQIGSMISFLGEMSGKSENSNIKSLKGGWELSLSKYGISIEDNAVGYLLGFFNQTEDFLKRDGSRPMMGNLNLGGYEIRQTKDVFLRGSLGNPRNKSISSLMPNWVFKGVVAVSDGDEVEFPICEGSGTPKIKLMMQVIQDDWASESFYQNGNLDVSLGPGVGWVASKGTDYSYISSILKRDNRAVHAIASWADENSDSWKVHFRKDYETDSLNGKSRGVPGKGLAEVYCHYE